MYTTHAHVTTWVIGIILFIIAAALYKSGKTKGAKIVNMILRLFYILIIITGGILFFKFQSAYGPALYGMKLLGGLLVIGMMEMVLSRMKKGKSSGIFWLLFIIFFAIVLYLGFVKLPMGLHPFGK
ncbi:MULTISPECIES: YisL family protein [Heyndrickxia]|uniref:YisL family protein n=1 Tax=Heyndrickxia TaxID=2837504 RepID=UPI000D3ACE68|nr:YisL family protein [Heyndrickxia sporothermodurans]